MNALVTVSCYATSALLLYVLTHSGEVEGLTAFGKSNTQEKDNRSATTPARERSRICSSNSECAGIGTTTCVLDKTDGKKHCLCKDGSVPINGKCAVVLSVPGRSCSDDAECISNAECAVNNITHKRECTCKEGYSFDSDLDVTMCNGAMIIVFPSMIATLALALTVYVLAWGRTEESS